MNSLSSVNPEDFYESRLKDRFLLFSFKTPVCLISTSMIGGGQREDVRYVVNHQICEGSNHHEKEKEFITLGADRYHEKICSELHFPSKETVLLSTAASMRYAIPKRETFSDFFVEAWTTAGVRSNASRPGDPACWDDRDGKWEKVDSSGSFSHSSGDSPLSSSFSSSSPSSSSSTSSGNSSGTINILLFISCPLSLSALSRSIVTLTEAKSSVLWELGIGSRSSQGLATGTGTDQFCVSAPQNAKASSRTWTGSHSKLGELIGRVVRESSRESLRWQNGLEASMTRSLTHALGRFGLTEKLLKTQLARSLSPRNFELFEKNYESTVFDPSVSASAYALASILDRMEYDSLPMSLFRETVLDQCALLSMRLAHKEEDSFRFRRVLEKRENPNHLSPVLDWILYSIQIGWENKWT